MSISAVVPLSAERLPGEPSSSDRSEMPALPPLRPLASVPAAHVEGGSPFRGVNLQSLHFLNFCCNFYFRGLLFCTGNAGKLRLPPAARTCMGLRGCSSDRPAVEPSAVPLPLRSCSPSVPSRPTQPAACNRPAAGEFIALFNKIFVGQCFHFFCDVVQQSKRTMDELYANFDTEDS